MTVINDKQDRKAAKALMSFFRRPITNKTPEQMPISLRQVWEYVKSERAKAATEEVRTIVDEKVARAFKADNFDNITPGGTFKERADDGLVNPSGVVCMDLDHLGSRVEELFKALLDDPQFATLLLFRSPRGFGLKWFVGIDLDVCDYRTWYTAIQNYLMKIYHLPEKLVDPSCKNISRACYLGYDPEAYICPALIDNNTNYINKMDKHSFDPLAWASVSINKNDANVNTVENVHTCSEQVINRQPRDTDAKAELLAVIDKVVSRSINITELYYDWLRVGFALAWELGSEGRDAFHQLSAQSAKYRQEECERKWHEVLRTSNGRTTGRTIFWLAKQAGIDVEAL